MASVRPPQNDGDVERQPIQVEKAEYNLALTNDQLHRGLKSRHIQFLALGTSPALLPCTVAIWSLTIPGGAIGTGLFIGSGAILRSSGPASLFLAYLAMMAIVWNVMSVLAEMTTYLPMNGITVPYFVGRFVDPSLAFASGWNYWYAYAMLIGAEATAAGLLVDYWTTARVNIGVWIAIVLVVILLLNIITVSYFGEVNSLTVDSAHG